ncbi:MAG: FkbM family methyltransferase [Bacteroidetes bacterium]|nr:MAG: FkbM family methyltransferase [Bacteroidota bacterium]
MAKFLKSLENMVRVPYRYFFPKIKIVKPPKKHLSYSQVGEDLIISFLFKMINREFISYLDIGANNPDINNNTYLFYQKGSRGICIEPIPYLYNEIRKVRPHDICLNAAVSIDDSKSTDFYVLNDYSLSTLSKLEAENRIKDKQFFIKEILKIPTININSIFKKYFNGKTPNLVSLDAEGVDLQILKTIDFQLYRPFVFCIETCSYNESHNKSKVKEIIDFMLLNNYFVYADTYINTIFVAKEQFDDISLIADIQMIK